MLSEKFDLAWLQICEKIYERLTNSSDHVNVNRLIKKHLSWMNKAQKEEKNVQIKGSEDSSLKAIKMR